MGCTQSSEAAVSKEGEKSFAKPGTLTSTAYTPKTPPSHWSDTVFLVPHEWIRREMAAMHKSVKALPDSTTEENAWKAELLATWIVQYIVPCIHMHHDNEEKIYLPGMVEKGCTIPNKKISDDHGTLMKKLHEIEELAKSIMESKGLDCSDAIGKLKASIPSFEKDMNEHLKEEEMTLPKQIKEKMTEKENGELIQKILAAGGLEGLQKELPGVMVTVKVWATDEFYETFMADVPPPIVKIANEILVPNYKTFYCAMRDAPTMASKPGLEQLPFDPSMLPPPPQAAPEAPKE